MQQRNQKIVRFLFAELRNQQIIIEKDRFRLASFLTPNCDKALILKRFRRVTQCDKQASNHSKTSDKVKFRLLILTA